MNRYTQDDAYFQKIDTERKAYWLGFLYADGCVHDYSENQNYLHIHLHPDDRYLLEAFVKDLKSDRIVSTNDRGYAVLVVNSNRIGKDLIKLGCVPRKSNILKFPTNDIVPKPLIKDFIRGYMDGDGCISTYMKLKKGRNVPSFICEIKFIGTYDMLDGINRYFNSQKEILINKHSPTTYQISFAGRKYRNIVDSLYKDATIYMTRKKEKWDGFVTYMNNKDCEREEKIIRKSLDIENMVTNREREIVKKRKVGKEVQQYDLNDNFIKIWENAAIAAEYYNTTSKAIRKVCTGELKTCCNFKWKYTEKVDKKRSKKINQYDINRNFIREWDSLREAAIYYNVTFQAIQRAISGKYETCYGFIWRNK
ncbi:MAG: NUMOD1 domain-containing DNA-binding protein [Clostridium sp.]